MPQPVLPSGFWRATWPISPATQHCVLASSGPSHSSMVRRREPAACCESRRLGHLVLQSDRRVAGALRVLRMHEHDEIFRKWMSLGCGVPSVLSGMIESGVWQQSLSDALLVNARELRRRGGLCGSSSPLVEGDSDEEPLLNETRASKNEHHPEDVLQAFQRDPCGTAFDTNTRFALNIQQLNKPRCVRPVECRAG